MTFLKRNGQKQTVTKTTEKKTNGDVIVHEVIETNGNKEEKIYQLGDGGNLLKKYC